MGGDFLCVGVGLCFVLCVCFSVIACFACDVLYDVACVVFFV